MQEHRLKMNEEGDEYKEKNRLRMEGVRKIKKKEAK